MDSLMWLATCVLIAQGYGIGWLLGERRKNADAVAFERARADAAEHQLEDWLAERKAKTPSVSGWFTRGAQ